MRENETVVKSRYGDDRLFFYEDSHWFVDLKECLYVRFNTNAIDPDGGPYIAIGANLSDYNRALPDIKISQLKRVEGGVYQLT